MSGAGPPQPPPDRGVAQCAAESARSSWRGDHVPKRLAFPRTQRRDTNRSWWLVTDFSCFPHHCLIFQVPKRRTLASSLKGGLKLTFMWPVVGPCRVAGGGKALLAGAFGRIFQPGAATRRGRPARGERLQG